MKYVMLLLTSLLAATPLVGMNIKVKTNACMVYSQEIVPNYASMPGGMWVVVAQAAMHHPKISPFVDVTKKKARQGAFIVPALVAYNSEAVKNTIMHQLPPFNTCVGICLDKGIQKTLFYGGATLAAYLFYTQTLGYLSKGSLAQIFEPLKAASKEVKKLAQQNYNATLALIPKIDKLTQTAADIKARLAKWEEKSAEKHTALTSNINVLKDIQKTNAHAIRELHDIIGGLDIESLTDAVFAIESVSATHQTSIQSIIVQTHEAIYAHKQQIAEQIKQMKEKHATRSNAQQVLIRELSGDVDAFFEKVLALTQSISINRARIDYALELAGKIKTQINDLASASDSSSHVSDDESDDEAFPRLVGPSGRK